MTFIIDTGLDPTDSRNLLPGWFCDIYPEDQPVERLFHDYGYHLISQIQQPKKMDTVRKHILMDWLAIRALASLQPGVFDELLCAYAERALAFE